MNWLGAALEETGEHADTESLKTFREHIPQAWIEEALAATGTATLRRRRLPADQVVWLVIGMAMMRDRPIIDVVSKLDLVLPNREGSAICKGAVGEARKRVGHEPMAWLFERCARKWAHESAARHQWRGLSLYGADGTTLRAPDSDENREHFGLASGSRGDSAYPLVRVVALMSLRSHIIAAANFGPYGNGEHHYANGLWEHVPHHSLTIVDKNFWAARVLLELQNKGENRHWLIRAKSSTAWKVLKSLGRYDKLVEFNLSYNAKKQDPSLPKTFIGRAISYRHPGSKGRQWLVTSLVDAEQYPAAEIVELYHERWEIELGYDELKTHMLEREEAIRSRTVTGIKQELWGILLAFNLIRVEMERIAEQADVHPNRISFVTALRLIRDEWLWCAIGTPGAIPKKLARMREQVAHFILPPRRSDRRYRREVKIKMSSYPKKTRKTAKKRTSRTSPTQKAPN